MTSRLPILLSLLCLVGPLSHTAYAQAEAPKKISVEFRGPLKDGLREIAAQGGINLIVTGSLDQPSEVYLKEVTAEEALASVAAAYLLVIHKQGSIWTLRPMAEAERQAPMPPAPPLPVSPSVDSAEIEKQVKAMNDRAEEMERQAKQLEKQAEATEKEAKARAKVLKKVMKKGNQVVGTGPVVVESGQVVDNAVSYGGSVTVRSGAVVDGDAVAFGGDVVVEDDAVVEGDAVSFGGRVVKAPTAVIEGDEVAMGAAGLGAAVTQQLNPPGDPKKKEEGVKLQKMTGLSGFLLRFALLFGLGFLFLMFAPGRMKLIEEELKLAPIRCGFTGLLGSVALVPLTLLLVVTVIGIPFAVALWILVGLGVAMGFAAVASELGLKLPFFRGRKTQATVLAIGLLALMLAAEIPVLGPLAMTAVGMIALGAIIRTRFGAPPKGMPQPEGASPFARVP